MPRESKAYLYDIKQAGGLLLQFANGKTFADYQMDELLHAAVEREFMIAGEALAQLAHLDEELAERVTNFRQIIAFRNILVHGYAAINDRAVWDALSVDLPVLLREVTDLLEE